VTRRLFLAVGLDDDTRHALAAHLDAHLEEPLPGSKVPPENWHITLRFLGKVDDVQHDRLVTHLDEHLDVVPFRLRFGGLGAFPRPRKATVAWLAVEAPELAQLAMLAEEAAIAVGCMPEERPFHPHLTLSRIRPAADVSDVVEDVPPFPRAMAVRTVGCFESTLRGGRPAVYTEVDTFDLG
jgi:2'-5' RNA ligase